VKLTEKDIEFLGKLRTIMQQSDLWVQRRGSRLVLRKNYGDRIDQTFKMTRQGVRWRFQRIADMYLSAFQTILQIEQTFGTDLRGLAIEASKHRDASHPQPPVDRQTFGGEPDA
jgi:hypothetical protein